jgi:acyl carrier protein
MTWSGRTTAATARTSKCAVTIRDNNNRFPKADDDMYSQEIRSILAEHARLPVGVDQLADDSDLYQAGLTSLSTVNLMLALEEHFNVEFLDRMLGRKTFGSIRSLSEAIAELRGERTESATE